jgi:hypothetical protein
MAHLTVNEIGIKLKQAGKLESSPLGIYGSNKIHENAISIKKINRCIANAIFTLSIHKSINSAYIGYDTLEGCCPGGQAWLGYKSFLPGLEYFISTGSEDFRGGAAEFLLANPELAEKQLKSVGKIIPLGNYTVIQKTDSIERDIKVKMLLCFGNSEQIRNLCSLAFFRPEKDFIVKVPWGPSCASFITYPANLAENAQTNCVIIGPTDPTGNYWFPENYLSMGIPFEIAHRMANDLNYSFIMKRPKIAYPTKRTPKIKKI